MGGSRKKVNRGATEAFLLNFMGPDSYLCRNDRPNEEASDSASDSPCESRNSSHSSYREFLFVFSDNENIITE